jgi:hypothetical protein
MSNTEKKGSTAQPLTVEEKSILSIVNQSGYNSKQLELLLWDVSLNNCDNRARDFMDCVGLILTHSEMLDTEEVKSVFMLFEFARLLQDQKLHS